MPRWLDSLRGATAPAEPRLGSRALASSFHLWWRLPPVDAPLSEVSAVCEVLAPPAVDILYFWALQVGFHDGRDDRGGAHTGLQWHGRAPDRRAVNWGGYRAAADGGGEFDGSLSSLPPLNPSGNTMRYLWEPGRPYRLRVSPGQAGWRAEVTDLTTGDVTFMRQLHAPGDRLTAPVVWSEVFAGCDEPSVTVRWSGLEARTAGGEQVRPHEVSVTYQDAGADGCENTTVAADALGLLQTTNAERRVPHGAVLEVPPPPA